MLLSVNRTHDFCFLILYSFLSCSNSIDFVCKCIPIPITAIVLCRIVFLTWNKSSMTHIFIVYCCKKQDSDNANIHHTWVRSIFILKQGVSQKLNPTLLQLAPCTPWVYTCPEALFMEWYVSVHAHTMYRETSTILGKWKSIHVVCLTTM